MLAFNYSTLLLALVAGGILTGCGTMPQPLPERVEPIQVVVATTKTASALESVVWSLRQGVTTSFKLDDLDTLRSYSHIVVSTDGSFSGMNKAHTLLGLLSPDQATSVEPQGADVGFILIEAMAMVSNGPATESTAFVPDSGTALVPEAGQVPVDVKPEAASGATRNTTATRSSSATATPPSPVQSATTATPPSPVQSATTATPPAAAYPPKVVAPVASESELVTVTDPAPAPRHAVAQPRPVAVDTPVRVMASHVPRGVAPTVWQLVEGQPLHLQLADWAQKAGWTFTWKSTRSWLVPADVTFDGNFEQALERVVQVIYEQGTPLLLNVWDGNHVAEVSDAGI